MVSRWLRSCFLDLGRLKRTTLLLRFAGHVTHPMTMAPAITIPQNIFSSIMSWRYTEGIQAAQVAEHLRFT